MKAGLLGLFAACLATLAAATPAFADIKSFNQAVQARDFKAAAVAAAEAWPQIDKARPDAPVIAREFAFISLLGGEAPTAQPIARWLFEEGAARPDSGVDPALASVLLRWAELGDGGDKAARAALSGALAARAQAPDPADRISGMAADILVRRAWNAGAWREVGAAATLNIALAIPLGEEGVQMVYSARIAQTAAQFIDRPRVEDFDAMSKVYAELAALAPEPPGVEGNRFSSLRDRSYTWSAAMMAYFESVRDSSRREGVYAPAARRINDAACGAECENRKRVASGEAPLCVVEFDQTPKLTYPQAALNRGSVGAVYLGLDVDASGAIADVRVLAAVPDEAFPEATLRAVRTWKPRMSRRNVDPACRMEGRRNLMVAFQLG
jgi:TonB family protein